MQSKYQMGQIMRRKFKVFPHGGNTKLQKKLYYFYKNGDDLILNHEQKATIIWNSYKERPGMSVSLINWVNSFYLFGRWIGPLYRSKDRVYLRTLLCILIQTIIESYDPQHLEEPVSMDEIDIIIKEIPQTIHLVWMDLMDYFSRNVGPL